MFAKFGFILLVLLFGGLMFLAGILAPPAWRSGLEAFSAPLLAQFGGAATNTAPASNAAVNPK